MLKFVLLMIFFLIAVFSIIFSFNVFILPFTRGVPYVPLKRKQLKKIFSNINFSKDAKIIDIGCGDGRVLRHLEDLGYKKLYGFELCPWPYLIGKIKNLFVKSKVKIYLKNFEKVDLEQYDVIFCYLLESYLKKLKHKFEKELKPGALIVSYGFQIEAWKADRVFSANEKNKRIGKVYIYKIKKNYENYI